MQHAIHVAGERLPVALGYTKGSDLYHLARVNPATQHLLFELTDDRDVPLLPDEHIIISGNERFSVASGLPADPNPTLRKPVAPFMNEEKLKPELRLHQAKVTFDQLARLDEHFEPGDGIFVDLRDLPDVQLGTGMGLLLVQSDDRLFTSPCGNVGFTDQLDTELAELRTQYPGLSVIDEPGRKVVILPDHPLAAHWSRRSTDLLLIVPQGFPIAAMDMFWVRPGLTLAGGQQARNADVLETYAGEPWQRFSWHYAVNDWKPGVDGVRSHLRFVKQRLAQAS